MNLTDYHWWLYDDCGDSNSHIEKMKEENKADAIRVARTYFDNIEDKKSRRSFRIVKAKEDTKTGKFDVYTVIDSFVIKSGGAY